MRSRQTLFFAVLEDIEKIIQDIEGSINIKYYKAGLTDNEDILAYNSIFEVPNIGITLSGDWNKIDSYLVMKNTISLNVRSILQRTGKMKFAIDQLVNSSSIELKLGGIFQEKENVLVAGRIATISSEQDSDILYKLFTAKIKKEFKRIGVFYVGRKAEENLKSGWRLVTNEKSPKGYDLALS